MPTGLMDRLPPPGLTPRELVQRVGDDIGVDLLRAWCVDLLRGEASAEDDRYPHIGWLGGTPGWLAYWARVWVPAACCMPGRRMTPRRCWPASRTRPGGCARWC